MTPSRRPAEMVRTRLRLTSSVGESAFSSDLSQEPAVRSQSPPARLPVPLIHQDGGTESVQRVFEECEVVTRTATSRSRPLHELGNGHIGQPLSESRPICYPVKSSSQQPLHVCMRSI